MTPPSLLDDEDDLPIVHTTTTPHTAGLGIEGFGSSPPSEQYSNFDPSSSPPSENRDLLSPTFSITASSPHDLYSPFTPQSTTSESGFQKVDTTSNAGNPFNFTPQQYTVGKPIGSRPVRISPNSRRVCHWLIMHQEAAGKRRGHTYQRSSIHISAGMILEPAPRAPLQLPTSLPTPTRREVHKSMTSDQKARLTWCICHFLVAAYVQWSAHGSLAMTALSRLLFFDAAGAVTCVLVEVMGNFEVWRGSTIKHPFGFVKPRKPVTLFSTNLATAWSASTCSWVSALPSSSVSWALILFPTVSSTC